MTDKHNNDENFAIELANTIRIVHGQETDLIKDSQSFISWLQSKNLIEDTDKVISSEFDKLFTKMIESRTVIRNILKQISEVSYVEQQVLDDINSILKNIHIHIQINNLNGKLVKSFNTDSNFSSKILLSLYNSLIDLLVDYDLERIKQCASNSCTLFFIDTSKNKKKKWCSMQTCGNREKAARHFNKKKLDNK